MSDVTYAALVGVATGAWAVVALYWVAEWVATWQKHRDDSVRRFFVEAGNAATLADLRVAAGEIEVEPFEWRVGDEIYSWGVMRNGERVPYVVARDDPGSLR